MFLELLEKFSIVIVNHNALSSQPGVLPKSCLCIFIITFFLPTSLCVYFFFIKESQIENPWWALSTLQGCHWMESEVQQIQVTNTGPEMVSAVRDSKHPSYTLVNSRQVINTLQVTSYCGDWESFTVVKHDDSSACTLSSSSVKCSQKTVKDAYHIICKACSLQLEICCKCGKKEDIIIPWVVISCQSLNVYLFVHIQYNHT